ncbi:hypothetical protein [Streptomyces sp. NPDC018031]|uniref:hypothetical protein n=1 Tax=Streptomyces sp. NPDC018031 TaxID=3365033 RepID=UPI0037955B3F
MNPVRTLRIAAHAEAVTLAVLLVNLGTVHARPVSTLGGPLHGLAYLVVIATTWQATTAAPVAARWCAVIPGIGGLLALRRVPRRPRHPGGTRPGAARGGQQPEGGPTGHG